MSKQHCVILVAHGSTRASWRTPLEALRDDLASRMPESVVRLCYLELCEPLLQPTLESVARSDYGTVALLPLFMSSGGHVLRDLLPLVRAYEGHSTAPPISVLPAFGELSQVREALVSALRESL